MRSALLASSIALVLTLSACTAEAPAEAAATTPPVDAAAPAAATPPKEPSAPAAPQEPAAPALAIDTLDHGRFDLAEQRGHWVVINFWATWCAPCLKEIPDFNAFATANPEVKFIGLAYEETTPEALRTFFVEQVKPEYPVAIIDTFNPPAGLPTPRGLPLTLVIGPDGALVKQFLGPVTGKEIGEVIAAGGAAD